MNTSHTPQSASRSWLQALINLVQGGKKIAPRGQTTFELLHQTFITSLEQPVVRCPARKLNYRFMAAEAYWILTGDDTVAGIVPYNSHIAEFSDDGTKFEGAYGPRIKDQLSWVISKLVADESTRQAGIIIWRDKPAPSKDIPCTVAIWFTVRDHRLNVHVFMRSSDVWLGLPYDTFSFSMLGWLVAGRLNAERARINQLPVLPGSLYLTAASSHLYARDYEKAGEIVHAIDPLLPQSRVPMTLATNPDALISLLKDLRDEANTGRRWWL